MAMAYHRTGASHPGSGAPPVAMAFLQTKPRIGPANGPLEREADAVADAIVSNQSLMTGAIPQAPDIQRRCAACESAEHDTVRLQRNGEEDEEILTKPAVAGNSSPPMSAAHFAADAVRSGGTPLSPGARAYFEPRFGRGLTEVRIHTHGRAKAAARSIGARAYTLGRDVAFADGEFAPHTSRGRHLLAHELTHVSQQGEATSQIIRRAKFGTGNPPKYPKFPEHKVWIVPEEHRDLLRAAMNIVDKTVNNPDEYAACHNHFAMRCPLGNAETLAKIWGRAEIWRITSPNISAGAYGDTPGKNISYTDLGYLIGTLRGAETMAYILLHEAGHNCGIERGDTHWRADQVAVYCLGASRDELAASAGPNIGEDSGIVLASYRRFLGDWAGGRLRLTVGADLNALGLATEDRDSRINLPASRRTPHEFGSAMFGAQVNLGGFEAYGGPRFGGIAIRFETGIGAGRFRVPEPRSGGGPTTETGLATILQVGPRAEFLVIYSSD